jgi:hypothetical protein
MAATMIRTLMVFLTGCEKIVHLGQMKATGEITLPFTRSAQQSP